VASLLAGGEEKGAAAEVCDLEALKAEMDGDQGQVLSILNAFDAALAGQIPRIESAYAKADWELLHRELHSIRGGSLNLFARELGGAAAPAERAAKERRGEELSRLLPELIRAVRSFHAFVEELKL
jgi:HPt (histidine-containing phosphotransfer) domain-containing protein